jgi:predicted amidohydrolase
MASFADSVAAPVLAAGLVGPFRANKLWGGNWMRGSTWVIGADGTVLAGLGFGQEGVATAEVTLEPV